ncbi:MAG TPA: NAD-dependent epimerase/dehydratase family protein, partial [Myxococcales bacterium]|nr:NAD-dependent epimerase/dehydratase family protein [Myxococcales bacterium]
MTVAFVAGASGYTGQAVVRILCEQGYSVVAHVRPKSTRMAALQTLFHGQGVIVDNSFWELNLMTETMRRVKPDLVFALLGTTRSRTKADKKQGLDSSYESVDFGLTKLLLDALESSQQAARFVYLSSMGAGGEPTGAYMAARAKCEKAILNSGLCYTIARPSFITGSDRDESRFGERMGAGTVDGLLAVAKLFASNN